MALVNVSENSGGDFLPICKYDSRSGRLFRVDKDANGSTQVDITRTFKCLMDFENVEIGHILFSAGGAPAWAMVPYGTPMPPKPTPDYKSGIRMRIKLAPACGGDVRELAGTANAFLKGINAVHDEYLKQAPANPGKLPVIALEDTLAVESGGGAKKSTNYTPIFTIAGWAARPADMPGPGKDAAPVAAKAAAPAAASKPAPVLAGADDDFG